MCTKNLLGSYQYQAVLRKPCSMWSYRASWCELSYSCLFFFFLKVNDINSWSTLCDMLGMNLCQVLLCISDFGITDHCRTPASRLHGSLVCCRKAVLVFFHSFWWIPDTTGSLVIPCFEEVAEQFVLLHKFNSSKQGSKMMLWIWFYSEQRPQENRAWRDFGMLSVLPSCSKTASALPDKMLQIFQEKRSSGAIYAQ